MAPSKGYRAETKEDALFRGLALGIVGLMSLGLIFALYMLGRPLYWKIYAEVIHRYEPDPALALIQEIEREAGECSNCFEQPSLSSQAA
jgi:hypothetical protein